MAETSSSITVSQGSPASSIVAREAVHFGAMAGDWWDPNGDSRMLHQLNPVRLGYLRGRIDQHWQQNERTLRPLAGRTALDVGCGAGLLAEPLRRLGASVTGVDAAPELIAVAAAHAAASGLDIEYRATGVENIGGQYDLVTAMEVIEHVSDPLEFLRSLAARLAPGGLLVMSTPNRTAWSRLLTISLAEGFGRIPKGTHDYDRFVAPERMATLLADAGLAMTDTKGIAVTPGRGLHLSEDLRLNYVFSAVASPR